MATARKVMAPKLVLRVTRRERRYFITPGFLTLLRATAIARRAALY